MVGTLHDCLVVAGVVFIHGDEEFHVLEVDCEFPHVDKLEFLGVVAGNVKVVKALNEHTFDVSEGFPDTGKVEIRLMVEEPGPIKTLKLEKDVQNILFFRLI